MESLQAWLLPERAEQMVPLCVDEEEPFVYVTFSKKNDLDRRTCGDQLAREGEQPLLGLSRWYISKGF